MERKIFAVVLALLGQVAAGDWYVSKLGNDANSGESAVAPKLTIQAAVDAASSGGTIHVAPGIYSDFATDSIYGRTCVLITNKVVTLMASGAKKDTVILGRRQANVDHGMGTDAVRGIVVATADGTTISGFTIRNCCTDYQNNAGNAACIGGGFYDPAGYGSKVTVVDCDFQACSGTRGGGANGGTFVRCRFTGCMASQFGCGAQRANAFSCVFWGNRTTTVVGRQNVAGVLSYPGETINCTIAFNEGCPFANGEKYIRNCLVVGNTAWVDVTAYFRNCANDKGVTQYDSVEVTTDDLFSPATGDWRLKSGSVAIGAGNVDYLSNAAIPTAYRDVDLLGNPRKTGNVVNCGAVEGAATPVETGVAFVSSTPQYGLMAVDGSVTGSSIPLPLRTAALPVVPVISFIATDGYGMVALTNTIGETDIHWPLMDETVPLRIASATNLTYNTIAARVYHVATDGNDSTGDGTEAHPYASFTKVIGLSGHKIMLVHAGNYTPTPDTTCGNSRLYVSSQTSFVRVKAKDGASVTTIEGASDPTGEFGLGENAVRCAYLDGLVALQGFTLRGGRSREASASSTIQRRAGGVALVDVRSCVADCVIEDCIGVFGAAVCGAGTAQGKGQALRCTIKECSVPVLGNNEVSIISRVDLHSCLFYGNTIPPENNSSSVIGPGCDAYFCTLAKNLAPYGALTTAGNANARNCVVYATTGGGVDLPYEGNYTGFSCGLFGTSKADVSNYSDCVTGNPRFASIAANNYRLRSVSPALNVGSLAYVTDRDLVDVTGTKFPFAASGTCLAGCFAEIVPVRGMIVSFR